MLSLLSATVSRSEFLVSLTQPDLHSAVPNIAATVVEPAPFTPCTRVHYAAAMH